MGVSMAYLSHLSRAGLFRGGRARVLDIGASNLYYATPNELLDFYRANAGRPLDDHHHALAADLARRSHPGPGYGLTYLSEVLRGTPVEYQALDLFDAPKTLPFDLNHDRLPRALRGRFDLVLNFGTTEHVFGQANAFRVIHDALKPGGHAYHHLPTTGYINHGYFAYHPRAFGDLAAANGYTLVELHYSGDDDGALGDAEPPPNAPDPGRFRATARALHARGPVIPNGMLNVLYRKETDAPFRLRLETVSSLGTPVRWIARRYGLPVPPAPKIGTARWVLKALGVGHALRAVGLR